jgi:hypothetical protein
VTCMAGCVGVINTCLGSNQYTCTVIPNECLYSSSVFTTICNHKRQRIIQYSKGKVVHVLKHHTMKMYEGVEVQ